MQQHARRVDHPVHGAGGRREGGYGRIGDSCGGDVAAAGSVLSFVDGRLDRRAAQSLRCFG